MTETIADRRPAVGAVLLGDGSCRFRVWAPFVERVEVHLLEPRDRLVPMERDDPGYHEVVLDDVGAGARYLYRLDGGDERPDPASRLQPEGVHGPSEVVDADFPWTDEAWRGVPLEDLITYELHVGTFSDEGTFAGAIAHLDELADLGVTAVEVMPVAQFPGERNWGYDGACPFAVQVSYGGPVGFKRFVDACHARGLAVILDVVYNHLGPEGNYLGQYGPYFTDRYHTPWGDAVNFDGPGSDEVRAYFIQHALQWVDEFHVDALRLDAVHAIVDESARTFLQELGEAVHRRAEALRRSAYLIAESDANDVRLVRRRTLGGCGLDAQWADDLHHALHALLTGEDDGYYRDFGEIDHLARALRDGYTYTGQYSVHRGRRHGSDAAPIPARRFVVCAQNHDQVGNRMKGERLSTLVSFEHLKLAAATVLLSPYPPLVFMGEEYGETAPFPYVIDHGDPDLVEVVREGRREEFAAFRWAGEPPDPYDPATFASAKLDRSRIDDGQHGRLHALYKELIRLRRTAPALRHPDKRRAEVRGLEPNRCVVQRRSFGDQQAFILLHFDDGRPRVDLSLPEGRWDLVLDTAHPRWGGPGSSLPVELTSEGEVVLEPAPWSAALYTAPAGEVP
ncbi:MAG: malto-oligosyltrehalose trehalohydrolase [Myxococcota bacterium]